MIERLREVGVVAGSVMERLRWRTDLRHDMDLEIAGHGKQPIGLLRAHGEGQLLWFLEVVNLGCEIVPPQGDTE